MGVCLIGFITAILVLNHRAYHRGQRIARERQLAEAALRESENRLKLLNENLERLVIERTEEVHALARALTLAEQRERQRLSLLLHEDLQQILFGAVLRIGMLQRCAAGLPQAAEDIAEIKRLTAKAIETSKTLSIELNPPILKGEGLDAALRWIGQHITSRYGLAVTLRIHEPFDEIDFERRILLVQFVRELLMNVVRHSGTDHAGLTVERCGRAIRITVSDQGRGFDVEQVRQQHKHHEYFGLFGIEERLRLIGGRLEIESSPQTGTSGRLLLPLPELKGT
jgi:signal transduction histidine kinase